MRVVNILDDPDAVYIGRTYAGYVRSKWANPYHIGPGGTRAQVLEKYQKYLLKRPGLLRDIEELRGKTLGCWCRPAAGFQGRLLCHGQILVGILEGVPPETVE